MTTGRPLVSLQFETSSDYRQNLDTLLSLCDSAPSQSIILAPEVSITDFDYSSFILASEFSSDIDSALLAASKEKTIVTTMIEEIDEDFYNVAKVYHRGAIVHRQAKYKLFTLGDEIKYFTAGAQKDIKIFEIEGLKIGILICFELRFTQLWQQLWGADIIMVPAQWGKIRSEQFQVLTQALAISNQCYVMASDAANVNTTAASAIITPFGERFSNQTALMQSLGFDRKLLEKMRRYIDVGLNDG